MRGLRRVPFAAAILAGGLAAPAWAQVVITVDDDPNTDVAYVNGVGGNFSGSSAVASAVNAANNDTSGETVFVIEIVDTDGVADTYVGDLHLAPVNDRQINIVQVPNGNGNDAAATLQGAGAGVAGAAFLVQSNSGGIKGLSPEKPLRLNAGGNTFVTGAVALGIVFENLDYVATGAPFDHNDFFGSSAEPFENGTTWRNVTLRNNNSAQVFNNSLFERVNFFGPGFPFVVQGGQQMFIECVFNAKAGPMHFGGAPNNSGATFIDCVFEMAPTRILSGNPSDGGAADLLSTGGTFHFIDPVFIGANGDIPFHLGNRNATLIIEGTDPQNKVNLAPMTGGGALLFARLYSGNIELINVRNAVRPPAAFIDGAAGAQTGDITISMDKCIWQNGGGDILFTGLTAPDPGDDFNITINAVNTIWAGGSPGVAMIDATSPMTGDVVINMEHCTMAGPTGNVLIHSTGPATANLFLNADYSIFDSSQTVSTFASGVVGINGTTNLIHGGGFPTDQGTNPIFAAPALASDGRLTAASPAIEAAVGSTLAEDVDGEPRPMPAGTDPDIGADEVDDNPPEFGWPMQAVRIPVGGTPPTIDGIIDVANEWSPAGTPIPIVIAPETLNTPDPYFPNITHNGTLLTAIGSPANTAEQGSMELYFLWDASALYVAAIVTDDDLNPNVFPDVNAGDCFQLAIDIDNAGATDGRLDTTGVFIPSWSGASNTNDPQFFQQFWPEVFPATFDGTTWAVQTTATGYNVEVRIPWTAFETDITFTPSVPLPPVDGQIAGVLPILDNHDGGIGVNVNLLYTAGGGANIIVNASQYSDLIFVETPTLPTSVQDWTMY